MKRPGGNHPCPEHWETLRESVRSAQNGECGVCGHPGRDLHHRHYDNWGKESSKDVVFLCRACHAAVTSRIREERFANGDRSSDLQNLMDRANEKEAPRQRYEKEPAVLKEPSSDKTGSEEPRQRHERKPQAFAGFPVCGCVETRKRMGKGKNY